MATKGESASFWEGTFATAGQASGYVTITGTPVSVGPRRYVGPTVGLPGVSGGVTGSRCVGGGC